MSPSLLPRLLFLSPKPKPSLSPLFQHLSRRSFTSTPLLSLPSRAADHRVLIPGPMDPALKHVPIFESPKTDSHAEDNPHNIPPEGDQDHGRSGWGFQSRSRHEHFTFPGEPEYEYYPDRGWIEWVGTPTRRKYWAVALILYFIWDYIPPRHQLVVRRDNDWGHMRTDSLARQGPDDHRPFIIRLAEWAMNEDHDWRVERWDELEASISRAERNRAYFRTMGMETMSRGASPGAFEPHMLTNFYPGDIITGPVEGKSAEEDAKLLGLDLQFFKAQPPHLW